MPAELVCFVPSCRARFAVTEVIYNCPRCGGLLETDYPEWNLDPEQLKAVWRTRRTCNLPLDQSGESYSVFASDKTREQFPVR